MPRINVSLAGAAQWTDFELTNFGGAPFATQQDQWGPILHWLHYSVAGAAHSVSLFLAPGAAAAADSIVPLVTLAPTELTAFDPIAGTPVNYFGLRNCRLAIPRAIAAGLGSTPWTLRVRTDGKTGDGTIRGLWSWGAQT